jgi:hypothetical protein
MEDCERFCNRTMFAVVLGVLSGVFGVGFCFLRLKIADRIGSAIFLIAWSCAIAYVTYDGSSYYSTGVGPGTHAGTLYFATWTCFIVSLKMTSKLLIEFFLIPAASEEDTIPQEGEAVAVVREEKVRASRSRGAGGNGRS